jgi:NitT/TauT family transport system permease protein
MKRLLRYIFFLASLLICWEVLARTGWYPRYLFPSVFDVLNALLDQGGEILLKTKFSLQLIGVGLGAAIIIALLGTGLAVISPRVAEMIMNLMAIMHPLPGIAILPIALLWLGTGRQSILAIIIFSAVWPLIANFYNGFRSVPQIQLEVGRNLGLKGAHLVKDVMLPASLPSIITGLRVGWARAWQSSVAAEMVFGAAGGQGGLGWFLYVKRYFMETAGVFAGLAVIVIIGIIMENMVIAFVENRTIKKWKMTTD